MRLGGCILLECAVGIALLSATGTGAYFGGRRLLADTGGEAFASTASQPAPVPITGAAMGLPPLELPATTPLVAPRRTTFVGGVDDETLLSPLRHGVIKRVKFNRGGSSISLRIDFEGGGRAAFKPDQTNLQTIPRKEVAAYRLARLIGVDAVAPAIPRKFRKQDLLDKLDPASRGIVPRFLAEVKADGGEVSGALMWWIPEIKDAHIPSKNGKYPIDKVDGMVTWKKALTIGGDIPEEQKAIVPQISTMVAFDYLISNSDRWSGSNTKSSPDGTVLFFMDNALSFGPNPEGHTKVTTYLSRVQRFSRSFVDGVRALDEKALREAVTAEAAPYERLLTDDEVAGVMYRREKLLSYVDGLIAAHGRDRVLVFP